MKTHGCSIYKTYVHWYDEFCFASTFFLQLDYLSDYLYIDMKIFNVYIYIYIYKKSLQASHLFLRCLHLRILLRELLDNFVFKDHEVFTDLVIIFPAPGLNLKIGNLKSWKARWLERQLRSMKLNLKAVTINIINIVDGWWGLASSAFQGTCCNSWLCFGWTWSSSWDLCPSASFLPSSISPKFLWSSQKAVLLGLAPWSPLLSAGKAPLNSFLWVLQLGNWKLVH